ncbi:MAG: MFS transporter [Rheinheimera sp.]|nr:MFS transporter [Rheinheimera sp.]
MSNLSHEKLLAFAYLAYFGVLGVFVPYIGLYLDSRGLNSHDIGLLLAIVTGMRIIGPSLWAQFAERRGDPVWVMRFGAVLATLGWCSSFIDGGYGLLLVGLSIYSLCWTAILPQLETSAFHYLENDTARYSKVRSAGSVGYILLVVLGGYLLEQFGPEFLPASALLFLLLMLVTLWQLPKFELGHAENGAAVKFRLLWRHRAFVVFMLAAFLLQVSFAPFYSFFTIYTRDLGYSGTASGLFIGLAVAAEIVAFYFAGKVLNNRSYRNLLSLCYGLTAIRWSLVAFLPHNP